MTKLCLVRCTTCKMSFREGATLLPAEIID